MNRNGNIILSSLTEADKRVETISKCPAGYIEVRLSTKGKMGAPEVVHVRNFKVSEILALSVSDAAELPVRLIGILNDCILEDVDVAQWHEKEVEELMVYVFMTFYRSVLEDIPFPVDDADIEALKAQEGGEERINALKDGKWIPRTTVDIAQAVDTYDLAGDFSPRITITNRKTGFNVTFDYIKYGDQIRIRRWLDSFFAKDEERFSKIRTQLEFNEGVVSQLSDHPEKVDSLMTIDPAEEEAYRDYMVRRTQAITDVAHIISIVDFDGEDVSGLSIGEKYERFAGDARIDYNLVIKLSNRQNKMKYGIKPEVSMVDPITREVVKRPLSFRIPALVQAMQLSGNDDYDDGFDDED